MPGLVEAEMAACAVLLSRELAEFASSKDGEEGSGVDALAWAPLCSLTMIWVVVMWVLMKIVEPAVATSKGISRVRLHINVESLQAEGGAIVDVPVGRVD